MNDELPVVVIGAGPSGLAAAAHLLDAGWTAGGGGRARRGDVVREWDHVRLFSRWGELVDPAAEKLLAPTGWAAPIPTGTRPAGSGPSSYLQPLADALGERPCPALGSSEWPAAGVTGSSTPAGTTRAADRARRDRAGEERITARAVVDASGTWTAPNPLGADGLPAAG